MPKFTIEIVLAMHRVSRLAVATRTATFAFSLSYCAIRITHTHDVMIVVTCPCIRIICNTWCAVHIMQLATWRAFPRQMCVCVCVCTPSAFCLCDCVRFVFMLVTAAQCISAFPIICADAGPRAVLSIKIGIFQLLVCNCSAVHAIIIGQRNWRARGSFDVVAPLGRARVVQRAT